MGRINHTARALAIPPGGGDLPGVIEFSCTENGGALALGERGHCGVDQTESDRCLKPDFRSRHALRTGRDRAGALQRRSCGTERFRRSESRNSEQEDGRPPSWDGRRKQARRRCRRQLSNGQPHPGEILRACCRGSRPRVPLGAARQPSSPRRRARMQVRTVNRRRRFQLRQGA